MTAADRPVHSCTFGHLMEGQVIGGVFYCAHGVALGTPDPVQIDSSLMLRGMAEQGRDDCSLPQTTRDRIITALDHEGAFCGVCGREPDDPLDDCDDCRRCLNRYADALLPLLATARTRPTRDDLAQALAEAYGPAWASAIGSHYEAADAVLALLGGDDK